MVASKEWKAAYMRKWCRNNKEKVSALKKRYYLKNKAAILARNKKLPGSQRDSKLRHIYGIDLKAYEEMANSQGWRCKICNHEPSGLRNVLHVDHDHKTGKVRGLLCNRCNTGLGCLRDDLNIARAAVRYLESSAETP